MNEAPQLRLSEAELVASICRESFAEFCREFVSEVVPGRFLWNWHIDVICAELQRVAERVFKGEDADPDPLIINIAPGTSKSTLVSILFPAWVWTRMPHAKVIGTSYAHPLALDLSMKCRDVVKSEKYQTCFPEVQIREDFDTKGQFWTTKGGFRYAVGAGGTIQGRHGDFTIIDDPLDPLQAISEAEIATVNYWINHTLSGRKTDKRVSATVLVMQRLSQEDPSSTLGRKPRARWVKIPATSEFPIFPPELANHYVDGLMDPARMPQSYLDEIRGPNGIGEFGFVSQYGEEPSPLGGGKFLVNMLQSGIPPGKYVRVVRAWDKAATLTKVTTLTKGSAFTVGTLMALDHDDRLWILDVIRTRLDSFSRERMMRETAAGDGPSVEVVVEQEGGSAGIDSVVATLRNLQGYKVTAVKASSAKEVRADLFSVKVNGGMVFIPSNMREGKRGQWLGWAKAWVDEARHWPHSTFLDQIDSAANGYSVIAKPRKRAGGLPKRGKAHNAIALN